MVVFMGMSVVLSLVDVTNGVSQNGRRMSKKKKK